MLSVETVSERIKSRFSLDFDCGEIRNAITEKSKGSIVLDKQGVALSVPTRLKLKEQDTLQQKLDNCVIKFINTHEIRKDLDFGNLILSYIYYSFNANTNNLLYLLQYKCIPEDSGFTATSEEANAINSFLTWDDKEKNEISLPFSICMF